MTLAKTQKTFIIVEAGVNHICGLVLSIQPTMKESSMACIKFQKFKSEQFVTMQSTIEQDLKLSYDLDSLLGTMVSNNLQLFQRDSYLNEGGHKILQYHE